MSRHGTTASRVIDGNGQDFTPLGLVIKVRLGDDVRRIPILNEDLTHDELMLMMQRVFRGKLSGSDEVVIKYADEDGDLVTIVDGSDLSFAIQCSRGVLNLTLLVNGKTLPPESNELRHVRQELQSLRKHVDSLLDALSLTSHVPDAPKSLPSSVKATRESVVPSTDDANVNHAAVSQPTAVLSPTSGREFDPLSAAGQHRSSVDENVQQKVLSSFGLAAASTPADAANVRSGTPDSVGSAHSSRQAYQQQVQTGYNQSQPAQVGYIQQQTGYAAAQSANVPGYSNMAGQQYAGQQGALPREPSQQQQSYMQQQQLSQQQQLQQQQQLSQQQQLQQQLPQQQQLQQQQLQQQQQYNQQQQVSSPGTGRAGPNPYASGLHYGGQYPRPHGQFPQAS